MTEQALKPLEDPTNNKWITHLPGYIKTKIELAVANKNQTISSLQFAIEHESGAYKDLAKSAADVKVELKDALRRALLQFEEARSI